MHISLETFNMMLRQEISQSEREGVADHILACDSCASRFRMLNQLQQEWDAVQVVARTPARRLIQSPMIRYGLGVAAVMVMALTPYLSRSLQSTDEASPLLADSVPANVNPEIFSILEEVRRVNYQNALDKWGQETTLVDLVAVQIHK